MWPYIDKYLDMVSYAGRRSGSDGTLATRFPTIKCWKGSNPTPARKHHLGKQNHETSHEAWIDKIKILQYVGKFTNL